METEREKEGGMWQEDQEGKWTAFIKKVENKVMEKDGGTERDKKRDGYSELKKEG